MCGEMIDKCAYVLFASKETSAPKNQMALQHLVYLRVALHRQISPPTPIPAHSLCGDRVKPLGNRVWRTMAGLGALDGGASPATRAINILKRALKVNRDKGAITHEPQRKPNG